MLEIQKKGKSQMKSRNKLRVFKMIMEMGAVSRTQIEQNLSLSAPSVTRVVEELLKEGLVKEEGKEATHAGRKPIILTVNAQAKCSVGINITKSTLYVCINNLRNEVVAHTKKDITFVKEGMILLGLIEETIEELLRQIQMPREKVIGIGIASRGVIGYEKGEIVRLKDAMTHLPVKAYFQEKYQCEVLVENNIIADLVGEYLIGGIQEQKDKSLIYIYLGEGVGGSIICNNKLVIGQDNLAAKMAHLLVEPNGKMCHCGKKGHLEAYASNVAVEEAYTHKTQETRTIKEICKSANQGEQMAEQVLDEMLDKLAIGILHLLVVMNPDTVILSGEVFDVYEKALEKLQKKVEELVFDENLTSIRWAIRSQHKLMIEHSVAKLVYEKTMTV